jgi:hypothetical protein
VRQRPRGENPKKKNLGKSNKRQRRRKAKTRFTSSWVISSSHSSALLKPGPHDTKRKLALTLAT